jgi:hypothetical protein
MSDLPIHPDDAVFEAWTFDRHELADRAADALARPQADRAPAELALISIAQSLAVIADLLTRPPEDDAPQSS